MKSRAGYAQPVFLMGAGNSLRRELSEETESALGRLLSKRRRANIL